MVRVRGLEPPAFGTPNRRSTILSYTLLGRQALTAKDIGPVTAEYQFRDHQILIWACQDTRMSLLPHVMILTLHLGLRQRLVLPMGLEPMPVDRVGDLGTALPYRTRWDPVRCIRNLCHASSF